jgi:hypothetical protein
MQGYRATLSTATSTRFRVYISFYTLQIKHWRNVRREQLSCSDEHCYATVSHARGSDCHIIRYEVRATSRSCWLTCATRLMKEYKDLTSDPLQDSITAGPISEDNMLEWEALIQGPEDTPYVSNLASELSLCLIDSKEGGVFAAKLVFVRFPR